MSEIIAEMETMSAASSKAEPQSGAPEESPECRLCQNRPGNRLHVVREMMFGTKDTFRYLECGGCGCLQLLDEQSDLQKYYPSNYYSFAPSPSSSSAKVSARALLSRIRNRLYFSPFSGLKAGLDRIAPVTPVKAIAAARPKIDARILDVGCGDGSVLRLLAQLGFKHLVGVDPFLQSTANQGALDIRKGSLEDLVGTTWDLIMFHHSFEHVRDPVTTLRTAARLLSEGGSCLIRMPVVAWPWKAYGVNWAEIDAPRHFFVHSEKSMSLVAEKAGLQVSRVDFDSNEFQLWGSELYKRDIPLSSLPHPSDPTGFFSGRELKGFRAKSKALNRSRQGGRAAFLLTRRPQSTITSSRVS